MADKTVKLKILLEAAGIKPTTKQMAALNKEMDKTKTAAKTVSQSANKMKRNIEGVAQRSGSAGKDFARMSQGMGGLVQVYATVAANVFALSSAFLILRKAADLSSMTKSAEDFSAKFGVSVTRITKKMQEASGGALDFAEALPSINKAVSAGVGIEQMEKLTIAATKAAQTFGGSTAEALNRFISASQRGRVEIIQTLGVVIKTEQAYKEYAASVGKTALELSAFDRQQAILNATIEASEKVFGAINIDPNPFTQFASTMIDVKDKILTTITDGITPLVSSFNQSKNAAVALMAVIASAVGSRIFPQLTGMLSGLTAASIKSTTAATAASLAASKNRAQANAEAGKSTGNTSEKALRKQIQEEEKSYKTRTLKHKAFQESLFETDGTVNAKRLNQQKAFLRKQEEAIIKGKGVTQTLSTDLVVVRKQIDARVKLGQVTNAVNTSETLATQTRARHTTVTKQATTAIKQYYTSTKAVVVGLKSGLITGFAKGFQTMQTNVGLGIKKMILSWKVFQRTIQTGGANSLKQFSEAFGRTVSVVAGGIARLISSLTSFLIIFSLLRLGWELYGDRIKGITKEQRKLLNSFSDLGDVFEEVTKSNSKYLSGLQGGTDTLSAFIAEAEFLRGTFDTLSTATNDFNAALFAATGFTEIRKLASYFEDARKTFANLQGDLRKGRAASRQGSLATFATPGSDLLDSFPEFKQQEVKTDLSELETITKALGTNIEVFGTALQEINKVSLTPVIQGLASTVNLLEKTGFEKLGAELKNNVVENLKLVGAEGEVLAELFKANNFIGLTAAITALGVKDSGKAAAAIAALANSTETLDKKGRSLVGTFIASGRALEEVNRNIATYLSGIEKTKAASVPNKEIFNLLLSSERALQELIDSSESGGTAKKLEDIIGAPDLENLRAFIGLQSDTTPVKTLIAVREELKIYNAVIQDSINNAGKFKVIQNQIFKLKNEEATTDKRRLELITLLEAKAIEKAELDKVTAQHQLDVAIINLRKLVASGEASDRLIEDQKGIIRNLAAEVEGHKLVIDSIEKQQDLERERFKIVDESLDSLNGVNKAQLSIAQSQQKTSDSTREYLDLGRKIYNLKKQELGIEISKKTVELARFVVNEKTYEQDLKKRAVLEAELDLLRQSTIELERQERSNNARFNEVGGGSVFTQAGMYEIAGFFGTAMQDEVNKLKSSFEILGQGFAGTLFSTFDLAVDNLLEGGRDFAKVITEGLKASLRDVFGEALKARIKDSLNSLFNIPSQESAAAARHTQTMDAQRAANLARFKQIVATEANTRALLGSTGNPVKIAV